MNRELDIIGVQMDFGASKTGVNMGPLAIRHAGLGESLQAMGYAVTDKGDILPPSDHTVGNPRLRYHSQICTANKALYQQVLHTLKEEKLPVVLGGDHSISAGSIAAAAQTHGEIGVLWIDAHGDFNDEHSSPSGNIHGMPLSALCGYGPDSLVDFGDTPVYVNPQKVCYIGVRELDPGEKARMKEAGVTVFTMSHIEKLGIRAVMERALEITLNGTKGVYVSYDMDSITPEYAPGVGTPIPNGLTVREAYFVAESIAQSNRILGIDMVEVNPMLDACNKTGELACDLILALLGKTVF